MPSGWTNSGIDWTSAATMRNSRTEDIVKHLHQAISELDHWISKSCYSFRRRGTVFPEIDIDARFRIEDSLNYIYSILNLWFRPYEDYNFVPNYQNELRFVLPFNGSVFVDFDKSSPSFDSDGFYLGYGNIDYSLGGQLESIMGFDVGFIRDYTEAVLPRVSLDDFKKIYDILNKGFYNRAFDISYRLSDLGGGNYLKRDQEIRFNNASPLETNTWILYCAEGNIFGRDADSLTAKNEFYNSTFADVSYMTLINKNALRVSRGFGDYTYSQYFSGIGMQATGFDGLSKNISDINYKSLVYGNSVVFDDWGNVFPQANYPDGFYSISGGYENYSHSILPSLSGVYGRFTEPEINTGIPTVSGTNKTSLNECYRIPFVSFDKSGVLNYYTEPTP